jgi:hypothetical protein
MKDILIAFSISALFLLIIKEIFNKVFLKYYVIIATNSKNIDANKYLLFICTLNSLVHGLFCSSTYLYLLGSILNDSFDVTLCNIIKSFSLAYFILDIYNMYMLNEIMIIFHHIVTTICLTLTIINHNEEYVIYEILLVLVGELTNPFQNYFFIMKAWHGEYRKPVFNTKYYNYFKRYITFFSIMRFIFAPIILIAYLTVIQNTIHYCIVLIGGSALIFGSMKWSYGQYKVLHRMNKKTSEEHIL